MKVAFILRWFPFFGGTEKITVSLANELVGRDVSVFIVAKGDKKLPSPFTLDSRVQLAVFDEKISPNNVVEFVNSNDIDTVVIQCPFVEVEMIAPALRAETSARVITVLHNDPQSALSVDRPMRSNSTPVSFRIKKLAWPIYKVWAERRLYRVVRNFVYSSHNFVLLSESYIPELAKLLNLPKSISDNLISIPNFLPDASFPDVHDGSSRNREIIYVGRITRHQKRVFRLIPIWKRFYELHPDWKFTIIGDGIDLDEWRRQAEAQGLKNVETAGFHKDVRPFLRRAAITLQVSDNEGFPMSTVEAMAQGCVPVSYDSFLALQDMVEDGVEGFNIPVKSLSEEEAIEKTVDYLHTLASNPELLKKMSKASAWKARKYSASNFIPRWLELLSR
ncbi:MAG: glycosyltransferase [Clostridium sp.]|nr:glycosyltransferase [Prevotella sp.]MCM1428895.1 glycosyltransferase [Clostridium sp.]